jgi:hypothetical protein
MSAAEAANSTIGLIEKAVERENLSTAFFMYVFFLLLNGTEAYP